MEIFSRQHFGCLGLTVLLIGLGVCCPLMISGPSSPILQDTRNVTAGPGALFTVYFRVTEAIEKEGKAAFDFRPEGAKGAPVWSYQGDPEGGVSLGGNALGAYFLAPTQPGTYTLKGKFSSWFLKSLRCTVTVTASGGSSGPALGLVRLAPNAQGGLDWKWTAREVLEGCSATLLGDGSVLVAGGWKNRGAQVGSSEAFRYWPRERKAQSVSPMCRPRADHEALRLLDGRILLYGGTGTNDGEVFDPRTNRFQPIPEALDQWADQRICLLQDGHVLVYPCVDRGDSGNPEAEGPRPCLLDPRTLAPTALAPVSALRVNPTLTPLPNGGALVLGPPVDPVDPKGYRAPDFKALAERYDGATKAFSPIASCRRGRRDGKTLTLANGKILIFGGSENRFAGSGWDGTVSQNQAERFDPATASFEEVGTFPQPDSGPFALLPDGSILLSANGRLQRWYPGPSRNSATVPYTDILPPERIVPLPDGRVLLLSRSASGTLLLYP